MSDTLSSFELTPGEQNHPLWARLKAHFEAELQRLRERNDRTNTESETATLRGEIRLLKRIIALGDPRPDVTG